MATDTIAPPRYQQDIGYDVDNEPYLQHGAEKGLAPADTETHLDDDGNEAQRPTEEEKLTLRKISGRIPAIAYWLCAVEFAERSSYYGVQPLFNNFVNKPLPAHGNGMGATERGSQDTPGALGMGPSAATAVTQSFSMLVYAIPIFWGWLADAKVGRYTIIFWGVIVCGFAHILMVGAGAPALLQAGKSAAPFMLSVYILAIGAAMFKPNISPILLDQMPLSVPVTKTIKSGERVIVDPDATIERVVLWFYWLINVGGFMNVPTAILEKYNGWWIAFFVPLLLYLPLPFLLMWLKKKLILYPPGGSELGKVIKVVIFCFRRGGARKLFRGDFFAAAKPSVIAESAYPVEVSWDDDFVEDVRRLFQATSIFCFFPIQFINDNGLGSAANISTTMFTTDGVPNDVISNFNSLVIILADPLLNYGLYPLLRRWRIDYGPVARMTTGLAISTLGGVAYAVVNHYGYKTSPCGNKGTSSDCVDNDQHALVSSLSVWWWAIPYSLGGLSELFVNVPAYGLAYSRAPKNMRGLVSGINLLSSAVAYGIGLILAPIIRDPFLTWDFAIPAIIGALATPLFWYLFNFIDKEEYRVAKVDPDEFNRVHKKGNQTNP